MQWFLRLSFLQQALLSSLLMYLMTTLGASFVLFSRGAKKNVLTVFNGGAAGIMIAASFFSLLLPALSYESALPSGVVVTMGFLFGGAFIVFSDLFLSRRTRKMGEGKRKCALLYLAVTLHNIPEGMAVGVAFSAAVGAEAMVAAALLAVGIAVQNLPEGMCVAFPLRAEGMSRTKSFLFSQGSGLIEIPSCLLGAVAASFIEGLMPWALSFSAGAMIAVVCSELIPECYEGNKTLATFSTVLGFCLMMLLDVLLG